METAKGHMKEGAQAEAVPSVGQGRSIARFAPSLGGAQQVVVITGAMDDIQEKRSC